MQGTIAQLLSLAAHGNEYLSGRPDNSYYPDSSTFKFCKFVVQGFAEFRNKVA